MSDSIDEGHIPESRNSQKKGGDKNRSAAGTGAAGAPAADGKVISARGTEDGLVLRIDGKAEWSEILTELEAFFGGRRKFFEGGHVALEWLDRLPTVEQSKEMEQVLHDVYGVEVLVRRKRHAQLNLAQQAHSQGVQNPGHVPGMPIAAQIPGGQIPVAANPRGAGNVTINLFNEIDGSADFPGGAFSQAAFPGQFAGSTAGAASASTFGTQFATPEEFERPDFSSRVNQIRSSARGNARGGSEFGTPTEMEAEIANLVGNKYASRMAKMLGDDLFYEDDANAKVVFGTLRSGQRLETPFSLMVIGDVNPGADLVAGGDIIVFGSLRGTAHASAYDDDAFDRVIVALQMQPMQLRIGSVISRGSDELVRGAEIARIENRRIIVETFNPRMLVGKKFR